MNTFKSSSIIYLFAVALCVVSLATHKCLGNPIKTDPLQRANSDDSDELIPMGDGGDESLFLAGVECGPDEKLVPGALPSCEPTCRNPKPICAKVFFTSLDVVPCFCKEPLVRNEQTKQCVPLNECPKLPEIPKRTISN